MSAPTTSGADRGWLRGPAWDLGLIAFGWVPFYAWVASTPVATGPADGTYRGALALATAVALALTYLHRHYVLLMVYGDVDAFALRQKAYIVAPIASLVIIAAAFASRQLVATNAVLLALGLWNVWHVVQQRYGILRIYGARARGGLETPRAARLDRVFLWASVAVTAVGVLLLRSSTFEGHSRAREVLATLRPWLDGWTVRLVALAVLATWAMIAIRWVRMERDARPPSRAPRLWFVASTFALLAIFFVHGPIVGYLVFGVAHSIEYMAFVHHFGEKKYAKNRESLAGLLLGEMRRAPLVLAPLLLAYLLLREHRFTLAYVTYYSTTSALHFLYDGWIWKVRSPEVARPLGVVRVVRDVGG